jgi:hypothetical protein
VTNSMALKRFTSTDEEGAYIDIDDFSNEALVESCIDQLIAEANKELPPGTVYEIRGKLFSERPWGVAWYWKRVAITQDPLFRKPYKEALEATLGSYVVIARCRASYLDA